jgi:hypothetical protein
MVEMKDHPRHVKDEQNTIPLYSAMWPKTVYVGGKPVQKMIGSDWRRDMADTIALAIKMNGYVVRGYFSEVL